MELQLWRAAALAAALAFSAATRAQADTALSAPPPPPPPPIPREFRGVGVATGDNRDGPPRRAPTRGQQRAELLAILDGAPALHLNAVVLRVRPEADALYESRLEPWSRYLTGRQGRAPEPRWDPLAFAV